MEVTSVIELELGKGDMLKHVQDVKAVRGMGQGISDHSVLLCKGKSLGTWMKRREKVNGAGIIKNENLS